MNSAIDNWIREAEEQWLDLLQQHCTALFSRTFLPSHDHNHHLRVWNTCKSMLREISGINVPVDKSLVEGLLVTAWFHDLGMARNTDKEHGTLGRRMCEEFFTDRKLPVPGRFGELLEAIEIHDSKEDPVYGVFKPGQPPGVLSILSVSDDLDALGVIGVYRYAEIYLHRGIPVHRLGVRILENGRTRYRNILKSCIHCPSVISSVSLHYAALEDFYNLYNQQLLAEKEPDRVFHGHLGIVNYIRKWSLAGRIGPEHYPEELEDPALPGPGETVITYFKSLRDELDKKEPVI